MSSSVLPIVSPSGGSRFPCVICGVKSEGQWCSLEHTVIGSLLHDANKPVRAAKRELAKGRQTRRGPIYKLANQLGILDPCARGDVELDVGLQLIKANKGTHKMAVSLDAWRRAVNERKAELNIEALNMDWSISGEHLAMLGPTEAEMRQLAATDPEAFEKRLDDAVEAFVIFRGTFFETPRAEKYIMKPFHRQWIRAILEAIYRGNRQLILAPPRSGKTDLAIHFGVWLILRNPNIRILWVGASADMAAKAVDSVRMQLEDNEELRVAYLPPGVTWKPSASRSGGTLWSRTEFTVATRTVIGSKSPTMVAVGSGGKILSRDTDVIWLDDLEDSTTVAQPGRRETTRDWLDLTVESRKETETALVMIGSRQHHDDLYSHLIEKETWGHIIEAAHDPGCAIPEAEVEAHVECMLFIERLPYSFLLEKKETMNLRSFEMQYINTATPTDGVIFPPDMIDACLNEQRGIGLEGLPNDVDLIAGLDPSPGRTQAAVLWAVDEATGKIYLVDTSYGGDGGVDGAKRLIMAWHATYRLTDWIIESNSWQKALYLSDDVKQWARDRGILLRPHQTGLNKWDVSFGVGSMRPAFEERRIDLPYGTPEAVGKVRRYRRQLTSFTDETNASRRKNVKIDLVMAAWFPWERISKALRTGGKSPKLVLSEDAAFPGYASSHDMAPWQTVYPGQTGYPQRRGA